MKTVVCTVVVDEAGRADDAGATELAGADETKIVLWIVEVSVIVVVIVLLPEVYVNVSMHVVSTGVAVTEGVYAGGGEDATTTMELLETVAAELGAGGAADD